MTPVITVEEWLSALRTTATSDTDAKTMNEWRWHLGLGHYKTLAWVRFGLENNLLEKVRMARERVTGTPYHCVGFRLTTPPAKKKGRA